MIRKGDKFTVEFTADEDQSNYGVKGSTHSAYGMCFSINQVKSHTSKPWVPKAGDKFYWSNNSLDRSYTIIAMCKGKVWVSWLNYAGALRDTVLTEGDLGQRIPCVD